MKVAHGQKKDFELHILRKFVSHETHGLRIKTIEEGETPDFVIRELDKNISVEMTRLILPALIQEEQIQDKIVALTFEKFTAKYPDKLQVLVNFSNTIINARGKNMDVYVNELLEVVESIFLPNRNYEFRVSSANKKRIINHFIHSIVVSNDLYFTSWQPFGAFMVKPVDTAFLKKAIKEKEEKIKNYTVATAENWLLLVANFGHESSTHEFYGVNLELNSSFDRVYLYKYMDDTYERLC